MANTPITRLGLMPSCYETTKCQLNLA